jgi:hypothetical protein
VAQAAGSHKTQILVLINNNGGSGDGSCIPVGCWTPDQPEEYVVVCAPAVFVSKAGWMQTRGAGWMVLPAFAGRCAWVNLSLLPPVVV